MQNNNKLVLIVSLIYLFIFIMSCSSNKVRENQNLIGDIQIDNHSVSDCDEISHLRKNKGENTKNIISGILEVSDRSGCSYVVFEKYTSRSKTGYYIIDELIDSKLLNELETLVGSFITIRGLVLKNDGFWIKEIELYDITPAR